MFSLDDLIDYHIDSTTYFPENYSCLGHICCEFCLLFLSCQTQVVIAIEEEENNSGDIPVKLMSNNLSVSYIFSDSGSDSDSDREYSVIRSQNKNVHPLLDYRKLIVLMMTHFGTTDSKFGTFLKILFVETNYIL